jgi:hypothetical protein
VDYSWVRTRIKSSFLYEPLKVPNGPVIIAVDSSGVGVHKAGGWVTRLYSGKRRYVKIHFTVDVMTKEVLAMERLQQTMPTTLRRYRP